MTEEQSPTTVETRTEPTPKPARKRAARKTAKKTAKKAAAKDKVTIFLVGASHRGEDGDRRQVDATEAEELVRAGVARYPAGNTKARRPAFLG